MGMILILLVATLHLAASFRSSSSFVRQSQYARSAQTGLSSTPEIRSRPSNDAFGDFEDEGSGRQGFDDSMYNESWGVSDDGHSDRTKSSRRPNSPNIQKNDDDADAEHITIRNNDSSHLPYLRKKVPEFFYSRKTLKDPSFLLGTSELLHRLCKGVRLSRPSRIQALAWPALLNDHRRPAIIADQTGSGKTLAYLIPLLQRVLSTIAQEARERQPKDLRPNGAPRLLVLAPTAELADQLRDVCQQLAANVPFTTLVLTANGRIGTTQIREQLRLLQRQPFDVLISTPGRIATILRSKNCGGLDLSKLQAIVLDEVDILLVDDTFGPQLRTVGVAAPSLSQTQFVFVTATLPDSIVEIVKKEFQDVQQIRGPGLHKVAPSVRTNLVDVSVPSRVANHKSASRLGWEIKAKALLTALRQYKCRRTLIFCNTVEMCRKVENLLGRRSKKAALCVGAYHNAIAPETRNRNLKVFCDSKKQQQQYSTSKKRHKGPQTVVDHVLVCTDRAARGVDFGAAPVDHVVLVDFPRDPAELLRRVGRTARAGRSGTTTWLVYGWQLPVAKKLVAEGGISTMSDLILPNDDEFENDEINGRQARRTSKDRITLKGSIEEGLLWEVDGNSKPKKSSVRP